MTPTRPQRSGDNGRGGATNVTEGGPGRGLSCSEANLIIAATFGHDDMRSKAARDTIGRLKIGMVADRDTNACRGIAATNP